ncbi:hypothetical protein JSE7799_00143 [Jannaschia seosinensis]|uniref:Uncharacterized protein n=1 Tax=Jannaschia seosinensis TaxID=313367 RepID=A0A0M7B4A0_9RHOB|nr:hypothetical protein [Jannaschia seosinensis]CUH10350.1 hypothetical protein JSE7799_00143 [Jannaschia seosinensis]
MLLAAPAAGQAVLLVQSLLDDFKTVWSGPTEVVHQLEWNCPDQEDQRWQESEASPKTSF